MHGATQQLRDARHTLHGNAGMVQISEASAAISSQRSRQRAQRDCVTHSVSATAMQVAIDSVLHSPITLLSVREEVWMTSHLTNCGRRM